MSDVTDRLAALEAAVYANKLPDTVAILQRKLEASWQPDAGVLLQPGSVTPSALAADTPFRIARGVVTAAGAVSYGTGFSVVRNALGDYSVTFTTAFAQTPVIYVGIGETAAFYVAKLSALTAPSAAGFRVACFVSNTTASVDGIFSFIAIDR